VLRCGALWCAVVSEVEPSEAEPSEAEPSEAEPSVVEASETTTKHPFQFVASRTSATH